MEKVEILGVGIDNLSPQEVLVKATKFLDSKEKHYIVTPNPEFLVAAEKDENFKKILNYADVAVADGVGLQFAAKFLNHRLQRVTGVDLVWQLCELAEEKKQAVYFLGAGEDTAFKTSEIVKESFPNLTIVGAESGGEVADPYKIDFGLVDRINHAQPAILFVAFGQVKQEKWIFSHLDKLTSVKIAIGVGGAFDYISGAITRAPEYLRWLGLEWLFRLIQQPERWRRIIDAVIIFPLLIIKNKFLPKQNAE